MSQKRASKVKARASRNHRKGPTPKGPWMPEKRKVLTREKWEELARMIFSPQGNAV